MEGMFIKTFKRDSRKRYGIYHLICTIRCPKCTANVYQAGATREEAEKFATDRWNTRRDESQWISVKTKNPKFPGRFLCRYRVEEFGEVGYCTDFGRYDPDQKENGGWYVGEVTNWMPLPDAPEGEE